MDDIKVTVYSACYNQKDIIKRAIDSILAQKTNFKYEIIIKDDASTDGTTEIIKEYQKKYPDIIKPIFETENQFSKRRAMEAFYEAIKRARGEYLAICEGDDYWVSADKLQKQVDFLDNNYDYSICTHLTKKINTKTGQFFLLPSEEDIKFFNSDKKSKENFTPPPRGIEQIVRRYCFGICSYMLRLKPYKDDFIKTNAKCLINWDSYTAYYFALQGKIKYLDNIEAVSSMGVNNVWNNTVKTVDKRNSRFAIEIINFPTEVRKLFDKFNCKLPYETPKSAMKRVLISLINLGEYNKIAEVIKYYPEIFESFLANSNEAYYMRKFKKYKKRTIFFAIVSAILLFSNLIMLHLLLVRSAYILKIF